MVSAVFCWHYRCGGRRHLCGSLLTVHLPSYQNFCSSSSPSFTNIAPSFGCRAQLCSMTSSVSCARFNIFYDCMLTYTYTSLAHHRCRRRLARHTRCYNAHRAPHTLTYHLRFVRSCLFFCPQPHRQHDGRRLWRIRIGTQPIPGRPRTTTHADTEYPASSEPSPARSSLARFRCKSSRCSRRKLVGSSRPRGSRQRLSPPLLRYQPRHMSPRADKPPSALYQRKEKVPRPLTSCTALRTYTCSPARIISL